MSANGDVICAIFSRRAAPAAISLALSVAAETGGNLVVLSSHATPFAWANPLAGIAGVPPLDCHNHLAEEELEHLVEQTRGTVEAVWIECPRRLCRVVEARLGEGNFCVAVVDCKGRFGPFYRLGRRLRESIAGYCPVVPVS